MALSLPQLPSRLPWSSPPAPAGRPLVRRARRRPAEAAFAGAAAAAALRRLAPCRARGLPAQKATGDRKAEWWWKGGPGDASEEEMHVYVPLDDWVKARDVVADIGRTRLTLGVMGREPVLDGELWKEIKAHESGWVIDWEEGRRCLIATLIKRDIWIDYDYLLKAHEIADTTVTDRCFIDISIEGNPAGRVVLGLYGNTAPKTCENFRALCSGERGLGGSGRPLCYKGTAFSRILPRLLCQGGDTTAGDGTGGESIYGATFGDEDFRVRHSRPGLLGMANSGPDSNASQFFITLDEAPELDGKHVVFGEVLEGFEVVRRIGGYGDPRYSGEATGRVVIEECGVC